jgi:hypothetical protein
VTSAEAQAMAKFPATEFEVAAVERWLRQRAATQHVRVRKHADTLVLESGPRDDPFPHARLRRVSVHLWTLEMPSGKRWQPSGDRGQKEALLELLVQQYSWMLTPVD